MPTRNTAFEFDLDLKKFAKEINVEFATVVKKVVFDLYGKITVKTPVDTGRARASWGIAANVVPEDRGADIQVTPLSGEGIGAEQRKRTIDPMDIDKDPFRVWWIYNSLPYIQRLEEGWSGQAPSGMVAMSIQELRGEIGRA